MLSTVYRRLAARRRARLSGSARQHRLSRPVVSVGNLAVGGRGKTPVVAAIATMLRDAGERPAILSRGYGRAQPHTGPVVVSDGVDLMADLDRAGDEPLMLARRLPGVVVVVAPERFEAGRVAEGSLGATVHILDDGFQHLRLARDLDLVIVSGEDLMPGARTLPGGRLREGFEALSAADAILLAGAAARQLPNTVTAPRFVLRPSAGAVEWIGGRAPNGTRVLAFAGIAGPERFFGGLANSGLEVADTRTFRDHHRYSTTDLASLQDAARRSGAGALVTTEKDAVRLLRFRPLGIPLGFVPLTMGIEPPAAFERLLLAAVGRDSSA